MNIKLQEIKEQIAKFNKDRDWSQFHDSKNLALSLVLEATEVLELFQWTKDNEIRPEKKSEIDLELADVLYWLIMLADKYDIDLFEALSKKMKINQDKYPIEKVKGKSKKYTDL